MAEEKDGTAWYNKGLTLLNQGRYEDAIKCYDEVLAIDPRRVDAWGDKGVALIELGRYEDAIKCYDEVLAIDPNNLVSKVWGNKARQLAFDEFMRSLSSTS